MVNMRCYFWGLALTATLLASCNKDKEIEQDEFERIGFKVLEYRPAPGQFINEDEVCTTQQEANAFAEMRIKAKQYLSLGAFGGYITVKMPKAVKNQAGHDFAIMGNAFEGSSEPGIVWVSEDVNGNCIADDPWYELQGGEGVTRGYRVTYQRPASNGDVAWSDNQGGSGVIKHLPSFHNQPYYPNWIAADSYTLEGTMLPPRTIFDGGRWVNQSYNRGYVDNMGADVLLQNDTYVCNQFDIDDAISASGTAVTLGTIHFIKVQSAVLSNVGTLGEISTEVSGFTSY